MRKLAVFNNVSLDGYFSDANGGLDFGKGGGDDEEFQRYVDANASGESLMLFGRKTYEMMASFWPTPQALEMLPRVAEGMNRAQKIVFSRTLKDASWNNTRVVKNDPAGEVRELKQQDGPGLIILGSGTIVSQLTQERLIDEYQFLVSPVVIGAGRTMFEGVTDPLELTLVEMRAFRNGKVLLRYTTSRSTT